MIRKFHFRAAPKSSHEMGEVTTPKALRSDILTPQKPMYFRPFIGAFHPSDVVKSTYPGGESMDSKNIPKTPKLRRYDWMSMG